MKAKAHAATKRRRVRSQPALTIASPGKTPFASIERAVEDIRAGRMVIVVDDADRENEGDLTIAAEKVTPETINFMARYGRGQICLSLTGERLHRLATPPAASPHHTPL